MRKVAVSAGHFPESPGAQFQGFYEHWEADCWADHVCLFLKVLGVPYHRVRTGTLPNKVDAINMRSCSLAIEIHFNGSSNPKVSGCETLYYPGSLNGKVAADVVQKKMMAAFPGKDRGIKEGWYKMDRPGIVDFYGDKDGDEMPDYFLRKTNCTALILEPEFISQIHKIQSGRLVLCKAIAEGCQEALKAIYGGF